MPLPLKKRLVKQCSKEAAGDQARQTLHSVLRGAIESAIRDIEDFNITSPQQSRRIEDAASRAVQNLKPILFSTSSGSLASHNRHSLSDFSSNGSENGQFYDDVEGTFLQILTRTKERYQSKPASSPKRAVIHALAHLKGLSHQTIGDGKRKSVIVSRHSSSMLSQHGSPPSADAQMSTATCGNDYDEFKKSSYQDFILYDQPVARQEQMIPAAHASVPVTRHMENQFDASELLFPITSPDTTEGLGSAAQSSYCPSIWDSGDSFVSDAEAEGYVPETGLQDCDPDLLPHAHDPDWSTMNDIAKRKRTLARVPQQRISNTGLIEPASMRSSMRARHRIAGTPKRMSISSASSFSNYMSGGETISGGSSLRSPASFDSLKANGYSLPTHFYAPKPQMIEEGYASQIDLLELQESAAKEANAQWEYNVPDGTSAICTFAYEAPTASDYNTTTNATESEDTTVQASTRRKRMRKEDNAFPCAGCDKVFSRACDRNKHQLAHAPQNALPYKCHRCNKTFRYPKDVRRHEKTHGDDNGLIHIGFGIA